MTEKRKKIVLSIKQKLELIRKFESGESTAKLANEYCIGTQTVRDINRNKAKLLEFSNNCYNKLGPLKRKSMKKSSYKELDNALIHWLNKNRSAGVHVSDEMCAKQAKLFQASLGLLNEFNTGWLKRFKQRYGIGDYSKNSVTDDNEISHIKMEEAEEYRDEAAPINVISSGHEESSNLVLKTENDITYNMQEVDEDLSIIQQSKNDSSSSLPNRTKLLPQFYTAEDVIKRQTSQDVSDEQDEFDLFGKSMAMQLRQLPIHHALICQEKLHNMIVQYRLSLIQSKSNPEIN